MSLAQVALQGHVTRDAELKFVGDGMPLLKFSVAVNTGFGDKKKVSFYDAQIWGKQAEKLAHHVSKGTAVIIGGEISIRKYTNDAGKEYTNVDVNVNSFNFAGGKSDNRQDQDQSVNADDLPSENDSDSISF